MMEIAENAIFKFVSLRRPNDGLIIDPTDDVPDSDVIEKLEGIEVNPSNPSSEVLDRLEAIATLKKKELGTLILAKIHNELAKHNPQSLEALSAIQVNINGRHRLDQLAIMPELVACYRQVIDSWLALRLRKQHGQLQQEHETLIRTAHLLTRLRESPNSLRAPGVIHRLMKAKVVLPRKWHPIYTRRKELENRYAKRLAEIQPPQASLKATLEQKRQAHQTMERRIVLREAIQSKANKVYVEWYKGKTKVNITPAPTAASRRTGGLLHRVFNAIFGSPVPPSEPLSAPPILLDDSYYDRLSNRLPPAEREEFEQGIRDIVTRPEQLNDLLDIFNNERLIADVNNGCTEIDIYESELAETLSTPEAREPNTDRPSVRAVGIGDLVVARERLVGYEAREIAHIENVLSGEEKVREHERTNTREEIIEIETTRETESERDLQTTDRYELQSESQKTINQEIAIQAGINTSGRYGVTQVDTSLEADFQQSQSESQSSSVQFAQDVVSRAVERTFESVRELRRLTITEQIRELNRHAIINTGANGNPPSLSGVYLWVEKIHEVELRQYGMREMVEFFIPEPAVSLLESKKGQKAMPRKPAPLKVGPNDITEGNYLCLARSYGAEEIEPPPPLFTNVGFTWASTPTEEDAYYEDTVGRAITIPTAYFPVSVNARVKVHPSPGEVAIIRIEKQAHVFVAVGGRRLIDSNVPGNGGRYEFTDSEIFETREKWEQQVPVSILVFAHWDKTAVVQITVRCERTPEALTEWKIKTWEKIRTAHRTLLREYEQAVAEVEFSNSALFQIQSRPEVQNREIEREELKKWAIKAARLPFKPAHHFDFNAVEVVGDYQEVDPAQADFQAPITRFFEEAFEWRQMTYFLYPYYWGRRNTWLLRQQLENDDPRHQAFLRAGAARVIVPVTPGYEHRALYYLNAAPQGGETELDYLNGPPVKPNESDQAGKVPDNISQPELWLELLINRNEELALGTGTLKVEKDNPEVTINEDSSWRTSERDLGREIYIDGDRYFVAEVIESDDRRFRLNEPFKGDDDDQIRYATGSVPYGPPWLVRIPTSLVILSEERLKLDALT